MCRRAALVLSPAMACVRTALSGSSPVSPYRTRVVSIARAVFIAKPTIRVVDARVHERREEFFVGHRAEQRHDARVVLRVGVRRQDECVLSTSAHMVTIVGWKTPRMQSGLRTAIWM